jgi:hypothetical protein
MKRLVIMTVGKTHSGKTTFAKALERQLHNSLVIDQDNHAEFINTYYKSLLPKQGPNTIKYAITQTIVDYAVNQTNFISFFATQIALAKVVWICSHIFKIKALSVSSSILIFQIIFFKRGLLKVSAAQLYLGALLLLRKYLFDNRLSLIKST